MTHDPLCPDIPCNCEPDYYGHEFSCAKTCYCDLIAKVRADEQAKYVLPDLPRGEEHVDWCRDLACYGCVEVTE